MLNLTTYGLAFRPLTSRLILLATIPEFHCLDDINHCCAFLHHEIMVTLSLGKTSPDVEPAVQIDFIFNFIMMEMS